MQRLRPSPAVVLFLLAPAIGKLLSSSMPPSKFFNPAGRTRVGIAAALLFVWLARRVQPRNAVRV
jgi:hypothetical protein